MSFLYTNSQRYCNIKCRGSLLFTHNCAIHCNYCQTEHLNIALYYYFKSCCVLIIFLWLLIFWFVFGIVVYVSFAMCVYEWLFVNGFFRNERASKV